MSFACCWEVFGSTSQIGVSTDISLKLTDFGMLVIRMLSSKAVFDIFPNGAPHLIRNLLQCGKWDFLNSLWRGTTRRVSWQALFG